MRRQQKKIVLHRVEDVVDFATMLYTWVRNGEDMNEIYSLFDRVDPFQYKQIIAVPDEEVIGRCEKVLNHKLGIIDRLEQDFRKIMHFDEVTPGGTILLDPLIAYLRKLEASDVTFDDVLKEMGVEPKPNVPLERRIELLQINVGNFEAGCSSLAGTIEWLTHNKQVKLAISDGALKK